jgi:TatD DNase family protein
MIDFHTHIDLYPDPARVAQQCATRGIYVLSVTTTPSAWKGTAALAMKAPGVQTGLGLHPQLAHERHGELSLFDTYLPDAAYVGEIGLDGGPELKKYWDVQVKVFDYILKACSRAGGRVMSIHSRRAASAVLDGLEKYPDAGIPILHWYSGGRRELERAIAMECWFSVGPAMLIGERGRELVSRMPRERVLTETDGPFAQVDGRSAMPWDAQRATQQLKELWKLPLEDAEQILLGNLRRLASAR